MIKLNQTCVNPIQSNLIIKHASTNVPHLYPSVYLWEELQGVIQLLALYVVVSVARIGGCSILLERSDLLMKG